MKKFLNDPNDVVEEMLDGLVRAHATHVDVVSGAPRALVARHRPAVGLCQRDQITTGEDLRVAGNGEIGFHLHAAGTIQRYVQRARER